MPFAPEPHCPYDERYVMEKAALMALIHKADEADELVDCPVCNGRGFIFLLTYERECQKCLGTGTLPSDEFAPQLPLPSPGGGEEDF